MAPTHRRILGLSIVAITLVAMLAITWRTWPEPIVDFGRELYVPWQLSQGKVLYRDIAYFNGPLSPYFNSLVFRVFGVRLMSLVWVNIAILAGVTLMLHRLTAAISDEFAATVGACAFLVILAIGQPGAVGNYNFVTPYSHEMTHGLALSLAAILCLRRYVERSRWIWIAVAGLLLGLVSLTKPEIFLATGIAMSVGTILAVRRSDHRVRELWIFFATAIVVPLIALGLLALALPAREAVAGIFGAWRWALDPRINAMPFYQRVRGTFDLQETARGLTATTLGYIALVATPVLIGWRSRAQRPQRSMQFIAALVIVATLLLMLGDFVQWEELGRPLVFVVGIAVIISIIRAKQENGVLTLTFAIFALLLLAKTALRVRLYHYGFALTAPALVISSAVLLCWLPAWLNRRGGSGAPLRGAVLAGFIVTAGTYLYFERANVARKTTLVGSGGDAFYAQGQGEVANQILAEIDRTPRDATLAVVPQGAMLNYLSRHPSSIPFIVQMPPEMIMFSQERVLESFRKSPPDYVLYLDGDVSEYGDQGYNIDFGAEIYRWIVENYRPIADDDHEPKWVLYKRLSDSSAARDLLRMNLPSPPAAHGGGLPNPLSGIEVAQTRSP